MVKTLQKFQPLKRYYPLFSIIFLLLSLIAGIFLVKQKQDIRDKAADDCSGCTCNHCPDSCHEDNIPNADCPGGTAYCCSPEPEPGEPAGCDSCVGSCDRFGCSVSGTNLNCKTDCNMWPMCYYCRGLSGSACGDLHGSFYFADPDIKYDQQYWCSTIQCDSNAPNNAAIVVFIGDRGEYCVEGTGCNPDDLDWDCGEEPTDTPTPTPTRIITGTPTPTRISTPTNTPTDTPTNTPRPTNTPTTIPTPQPNACGYTPCNNSSNP
ncbi:hypothetical protein KKE45_01055, partial [Patescibacteria group bacterium]|nr:hypothetical protein [Patescibacteria group bacterium]